MTTQHGGVGEDAMAEIRAAVRSGGRRPRRATFKAYPMAAQVHDCGLVGRAEIMEMAGYDPDQSRSGPAWFTNQIDRGMLPPADGQRIDGRPTWRRDTILVHLYQRRNHHKNGDRYLIPELWPEAERLLAARDMNKCASSGAPTKGNGPWVTA